MSARGSWTSSYGFIVAAIGSAVGLGNLWRFPYLAGNNGGGAFVLLYLFMILTLGVSLSIIEQAIGRYTRQSPHGAFRTLCKPFTFAGSLCIASDFLILAYYSMIGGWIVYYLVTAAVAPEIQTQEGFSNFIDSPWKPVLFLLLFMGATAYLVYRGINKGIEIANRIMMPLLFVILLVIVVRAVTLPGAKEGIEFLLQPDFSKITVDVVIAAMGQVFFSMSVGLGIMLTYSSYMRKESDIIQASWVITFANSFVAILAGLAILPAVFAFGLQPEQGPKLLFVIIPGVFEQMSFGHIFNFAFFVLVFFAALTSSISILEVLVAFLIDEFKFTRSKAVIVMVVPTTLLGVACVFSMNKILGWFLIFGKNIFDLLDYLTCNIMLPVGGILLCIVGGWIWGIKNAEKEITNDGRIRFPFRYVWKVIILVIAPIAIVCILLSGLELI